MRQQPNGRPRQDAARPADPRAHRLQPAGRLRARRADRRRTGTATVDGQAARQPDPLPGDGGGRGGRQAVRQGRVGHHRPPAADGAAVAAALPQLRRPRSSCRSSCRTRPTTPMTVDVARAARTQPGLLTERRWASAVTVPADDRVEVRFPADDRQRGHGALPGRAAQPDLGRLGRRGRVRAAGLDAGDHRGVRHLRRDRRGRRRPAGHRADATSSPSSAGWRSPRRRPRCRR